MNTDTLRERIREQVRQAISRTGAAVLVPLRMMAERENAREKALLKFNKVKQELP